jgi:hypothetical protein
MAVVLESNLDQLLVKLNKFDYHLCGGLLLRNLHPVSLSEVDPCGPLWGHTGHNVMEAGLNAARTKIW